MLVHGEGDCYGEPYRIRPHTVWFIYKWFEYEPNGDGSFRRWHFDHAFRELAKGGAKTEDDAAIALAELGGPTAPAAPNIPVAAASFEQADLLFGRAKQMSTHENSRLRPFVEAYDTEILLKGRQGRMFRIAAEAGTNDGGLPTLFATDELHEWVGRKERLYLIVGNSVTKRNDAHGILSGSTPGHDLKTVAGRLHQKGLRGDDPRFLHQWITADPTLDLSDAAQLETAVRQANPWATDDHIERLCRRYAEVPEYEFRRYHLCQWVEIPEDGWLADKPGAWEACEGNATFEPGAPLAMGVDMSLYRDSTAVAFAQHRSDGRVPVRVRVFEPAPGGGIDHEAVRDFIKRTAHELNAKVVAYDPYAMKVIADELEDAGLPMLKMPQSPETMSPACARVYDMILDQTIVHDGDPILAAHVKAAARKENERGWRLSKGRSKTVIDGCIAMVMAVSQVMEPDEDLTEVYSW